MPQDRALLLDDNGLRVERVRFHAGTAGWSPAYRAPSQRLVFPAGGATQFLDGGHKVLVDSLTAFRIGAAVPYRLKPEPQAGERTSIVVSDVTEPPCAPGSATLWLLSPPALFSLCQHWRSLQRGDCKSEATAAIVSRALQTALPLRSGDAPMAHVLRARLLLVAQPGGTLSLREIAEAAHSSPFHLARSFREHIGLSLHQYRQHLRLALALQRLEQDERDLAGLANDLGFCSQSHFGAVFRREVGVTPACARQFLGHRTAGI